MSIGRRIKGAFIGMLFGILLVPGSIALHAWNEYRTIHRSKGLAEAERDVVSLGDIDQVASEHNNQLVHLSGPAHTDEVLEDAKFGVRDNAIHFRRRVEMYQWVEHESRRDDRTTYSYRKEWHEGRVASESFRRNGHTNPALKYRSEQSSAKRVTLGAYLLTRKLLIEMDDWLPVEINESALREVTVGEEGQFLVEGNELYWGKEAPNLSDPQLGDIRIFFEVVKPADVSIMARLQAESFSTYNTSNGEPIEDLYYGQLSAGEFIGKLKTENSIMAWAIRFGGFVMCGIGISLIFGPAKALVSWIPMVGDVTGFMIVIVSFLIASIISLCTISISWLAVRPVLGLTLLLLTAVLVAALVWVRKTLHVETQPGPQVIDASMIVE